MRRAAFLTIPFAASLLAGAPQPAEARSKAYCRDYAQQIASREAAGGIELGVAPEGAAHGMVGTALDSHDAAGGSLGVEPAGIPVPASDPASGAWQHAYRRAYAECRAS